MPGLALLALARGRVDDAAASVRRALQEGHEPWRRPTLLAAAVDVFRESQDLGDARKAADELVGLAADSSSHALQAMADQATGTVLLAEGDPALALQHLRAARVAWQMLGNPYQTALTEVLLGLACLPLGDRNTTVLEFENARETFNELGANPDLNRLRTLATGFDAERAPDRALGLTRREIEVLARVAAGETNKEIASKLAISQHTVGRHLENIFAKLGVRGRTAATAYAYEHHLL